MNVNLTSSSNVTNVNNNVFTEHTPAKVDSDGSVTSSTKSSRTKTSLELIGMETIASTGEYRILKKHSAKTDPNNSLHSHLMKPVNTDPSPLDHIATSSSGASLVESRQDASLSATVAQDTSIRKTQSAAGILASQTITQQNTSLESSTCTKTQQQETTTSVITTMNTEERLESRHPATRKMSEQEIASSWEKIVSAAELVNGQGELIDLIKFADQEEEAATGDNAEKVRVQRMYNQ